MPGRYDRENDWRGDTRWREDRDRESRFRTRDPWWFHDQNPAQGFSAWRGDASDRDWHERYGGYAPERQYGRPYSARDWRGFRGGEYAGNEFDRYERDDLGRYDRNDAFSRDWDYAGYGVRGHSSRDRYRPGRYAGLGPKGYRRSDERIREDINDLLTADPDIDASDIEVRVANGVVTLTGTVEDRSAKRLAEDLAQDVIGVDDVSNQLKVRRGFLAGLTGEKAEDRELPRQPAREGTANARRTRTNA